jgi:hypothetical protein
MNRQRSTLSFARQVAAGWVKFSVVACLLVFAAHALNAAEQPQPRIDFIESYPNDHEVVIHFAGVINRTCALQYLDRPGTNSIIAGSTSGSWSNLFVAENFPFPTHYVIPDKTTNGRQRFYRLRVTNP